MIREIVRRLAELALPVVYNLPWCGLGLVLLLSFDGSLPRTIARRGSEWPAGMPRSLVFFCALFSVVYALGWLYLRRHIYGETPKTGEYKTDDRWQARSLWLLSTMCYSFIALELNVRLDQNSSHSRPSIVLEKKDAFKARYHTPASLYVMDWNPVGGVARIFVRKRLFNSVEPGDRVTVVTKPGLLGYEWVVSVDPAAKTTTENQ
jgi:hypothetical protein